MAKLKNYRKGQGTFVVPPQGRPPQGGLPGESREDRDRRVMAHIQANPKMSYEAIARALGTPLAVVKRQAAHIRVMEKEAAEAAAAPAKFLPNQLFTPSPPPPPTPIERLAAVSDDVKAEIAARYGVVFRS
jgi:hypothetical protein